MWSQGELLADVDKTLGVNAAIPSHCENKEHAHG
jgi:hypothetical protein